MARMNPKLREWLEVWGDHRAKRVPELEYPSQTIEASLRDFRITDRARRKSSNPTARAKESRTTKPRVPNYEPNQIAFKVEKASMTLEHRQQIALWCRYVAKMEQGLGARACGFDSGEEYRRFLEAATTDIGRALGMRVWSKAG